MSDTILHKQPHGNRTHAGGPANVPMLSRIGEILFVVAATVLGLLPIILWMAWSKPVLGYSLLTGAVCFGYITLFCLGPLALLRSGAQRVINLVWYTWHWQRRLASMARTGSKAGRGSK